MDKHKANVAWLLAGALIFAAFVAYGAALAAGVQ